ncbi:hypothetical protein VTN49DRAFT_2302 [Thermomyces lanuginosus]|uniref:uncharacterized protein n=1 Tax=Thermomyces lanuginosus TaxID=5541 RepID=UPI0037449E85
MSFKVGLIIGSTRTPRVGPKVADWVHQVITSAGDNDRISIERVDLADFKLPVFDEGGIPVAMNGKYEHEHSKRWGATIGALDAFVFVIPEYNANVAAATKNAIDYLYHEWTGKPVAIVSYGMQGGKHASAALALSLETVLKMRVAPTRPQLAFGGGFEGDGSKAAIQGELGERSIKEWEENGGKDDILKAWSELKKSLTENGVDQAN